MFLFKNKRIESILVIMIRIGFSITLMIYFQSLSYSGELRASAGVSTEIVVQHIETKEAPKVSIDATNIIIKPFASLSYQAKDFDVFFQGTNNQVRRKLENETTTQDFTEYNYSGNFDIVDKVLSFRASGNRSYRNNAINSFLVDDFLLNADSLNKVSTDRSSLQLNIRRGEFYGLSATTSYSTTTSDLSNTSEPDDSIFKNESYQLSFNAVTGESFERARVVLSGNTQYLKRNNGQDFVSQRASISSDIEAYGDFGFTLNGSYENNEIKTDFNTENNGLREFYSFGAGLIWQPRDDRYIKVLLNRSYTSSLIDDESDDEDSFLSYNINWAFSARTSIQGNFTRRFFGDAGNLSFLHRTKNWRSSVTYTEIVSSTSQLRNSNDVGLFICENGSSNITDCRLSETLEPELEQGEVLQPFAVQNLAINDRIILRKSLTAQTAVTRRRTTLSLTGTRSEDEEIEINRIFDVNTIRANLSFSLTRNTSLQYRYTYAQTERDQDGELESATTQEHSIEMSRRVSERFSTSLGLRYLDREGEINRGNQSFRGLNGPLTDRRITFRISYNLGNR